MDEKFDEVQAQIRVENVSSKESEDINDESYNNVQKGIYDVFISLLIFVRNNNHTLTLNLLFVVCICILYLYVYYVPSLYMLLHINELYGYLGELLKDIFVFDNLSLASLSTSISGGFLWKSILQFPHCPCGDFCIHYYFLS